MSEKHGNRLGKMGFEEIPGSLNDLTIHCAGQ
jgi:hypothetical protein